MPQRNLKQTKFIIVTGGVLSGLGKGVAAAALGKLLSSQYSVIPLKLDGYLNVDPGTMNPIEHGEVFVLDDGGEVDMDFGHYERFLAVKCKFSWNLTMGKVFQAVRTKERRGDYLGQTVQYIPHVTNYIVEHLQGIGRETDIVLVEVGGTVGDLENELYIEAVRQLRDRAGKENVTFVHLTYVPYVESVGEQKSKPTQQSVALLRQRGIQPDIIIGRSSMPIDAAIKRKIAAFCGVAEHEVFSGVDTDSVYKIPLLFDAEGMTQAISRKLNIPVQPNIGQWKELLGTQHTEELIIAICGKYTSLEDSYASVVEAVRHAAAHLKTNVKLTWLDTTGLAKTPERLKEALNGVHGVIVPGGFGSRGAEGKIAVIQHCRVNDIPFLGLCYGLQLAVIEHARNCCKLQCANSTEIDPDTPHPVVDLLPEQQGVKEKGATMRLGGQDISLVPETKTADLFGDFVRLRFRHRYEVNPLYVDRLEQQGLIFSGKTPDGSIMQVLERTDSRFFMATQAHPELTSWFESPSPFFQEFLKAGLVLKRTELLVQN